MGTTINSQALEMQLAQIHAVAERYAAEVRARFGKRVRRIRLYGSAARGDWTPESDIDVLVLLDEVATEDSRWLSARAFAMGLMETGLLLQPLYMPEADFTHLRNRERRFALEVEKEGMDL